MTIEQFDDLVRKEQEKRDKLSAEIADLIKKENELDGAAKKAAESDNVEAYIEKMNEKTRVSAAVLVKRTCLDKIPKPDLKNEAQAAWKDYAGDYNRKMKKALAGFEAEKSKLLKAYSDLVDLQLSALKVRKRIGEAAGINEGSFPMEFIPVKSGLEVKGQLKLGGFNCMDADACYYLAAHCQKNNTTVFRSSGSEPRDREEARITSVVVKHSPDIVL